MLVVYLAHQLSAPTREGIEQNRRNAAKWAAWLWRQGFSVECSWIVCTGELEETPENRELGLKSDCEQARRCDVMVLCGPKISSGMLREAGAAKVIIDFTYLGLELPPADLEWFNGRPVTLKILEEMDLMNAAIEENNKRAGNSDKTTPSPPPSLGAAELKPELIEGGVLRIRPPSNRPTWPETWMAIAHVIAMRSYDPRLKVGAIIISSDNTQMLSGGYNGNYAGGPHEHESPVPGESGFIHAEMNALIKLDFNFGKDKHMYITHSPCKMCAKLIINAGIKRVVYEVAYRDPAGIQLLHEVGIETWGFEQAVRRAVGEMAYRNEARKHREK